MTDFITPELLLRAYAAGVFPMSEGRDSMSLFWVNPQKRGIIPLDGFHVPRSLRKKIRKNVFEVRCDTAFRRVMECCAAPRTKGDDTWINDDILELYCDLHAMGFAHSVECWRDGELVGGLYGVSLGGAFFGESMFSRETDASKVALVHLVARLRIGGYRLLDTQFLTEHLGRFGTIEITRPKYLALLEDALQVAAIFYAGNMGERLESEMERLFAQ
ncbi:MAG: leucyl/phenylalanyl-tRNA--protein transferase [Rhodospirillales bacterium]|nr:leucyl/phenylalanyl-tRNA--protein transferase [Rhodospirillales bacterium]MCW8861423.1 leucyl/phenylalanyl-tRNA--protein transferase [Rhodospirillales bacterium]MCW8951976.1 leucyl/phenylalanyl-tRNA--protein transferase [Rhodospirillales bacterium]MCW9001325.1 leucyl/phenylalanyl-tRNA--protein transferase [Rhodospirillales bacterium]MCW9040282.1 leucyl/phenylalanyl-tRNA--protein transferase [Rhodospirillales bacterium]